MIAALLGGLVILGNYGCIAAFLIWKKHHSMIPLLGGVFVLAAMEICPYPGLSQFAWLPLVIDPGCLYSMLGFLYVVVVLRDFRGERKD